MKKHCSPYEKPDSQASVTLIILGHKDLPGAPQKSFESSVPGHCSGFQRFHRV